MTVSPNPRLQPIRFNLRSPVGRKPFGVTARNGQDNRSCAAETHTRMNEEEFP